MTIKDFFKKIFPPTEKEEEPQKQTTSLDELPKVLEEKIKLEEENLEKQKSEMLTKISEFESSIKGHIETLNQITLEKKREREVLKKIVLENLHKYIAQLERFIEDLKSAEHPNTKEYLIKIEKINHSFSKISRPYYEKATILIGNELASAKNEIHNFYNTTNPILRESAEISKRTKKLTEIQNILSRLSAHKLNENEITERINKLEKNIGEIIIDIKENKEKINKIKSGEEYNNAIKEEEQAENKISEIRKKLSEIKQSIDFRTLLKHFHGEDKKSRIIRNTSESSYFENFDEQIIDIVKESTGKDISQIKTLLQEIENTKNRGENETLSKLSELKENSKKYEYSLENAKQTIREENKKLEKMKEKEKEINLEIINAAYVEEIEIKNPIQA